MTIKKDIMAFGACLVVYAVIQGLIMGNFIGPFWVLNIVLICINIILATSLNLINGITGQFSIGHAGFMAVGAYLAAVCTVKFQLPFIVAIMVGAVAAGLLGFLIGLPTLRLSGDYLAIATLGLGEIIRITILNIPYVGGASGMMGIPRFTTFTWVFFAMIFKIFFIKIFLILLMDEPVFQSGKMKLPLKLWGSIQPSTKCWLSLSVLCLPVWRERYFPITFILPIRHRSLLCVPLTSSPWSYWEVWAARQGRSLVLFC